VGILRKALKEFAGGVGQLGRRILAGLKVLLEDIPITMAFQGQHLNCDDGNGTYDSQEHVSTFNVITKKRRPRGSSVSSEVKKKATGEDPNHGKCLITRQSVPIEAWHIVPKTLLRDNVRLFALVHCDAHSYLLSWMP